MAENFELLETGQIEIMHQQVHDKLESADNCDTLRIQHDSLAAELVKRGLAHDTEIVCSEIETDAPNYRRGFTDDICATCAFGQLSPFCNLYKFEYLKDYTCDSFRYFEVLELEAPHGFLMINGKQTAHADIKQLDINKAYLIVSAGECFGIAEFEKPAQLKTKQFDTDEWLEKHRITQRERRQWWPDNDVFYIHPLKHFSTYEGVKLYENNKVISEPRLSAKQWQIVSAAKQLPKQIQIQSDAVSITDKREFLISPTVNNDQLKNILAATFEAEIKSAKKDWNETIDLYSLALVRNPRMRVSKKKIDKQEGEIMPFGIVQRDGEHCVINTDTEETIACHETEAEAEAQLVALRVNVEAEEETRADKPRKKEVAEIDINGEKLYIPVQTLASPPKKAGFIEGLRNVAKSITDFLKQAETEKIKLFMNETGVGQKIVNGNLWHFTYSTNAFEDRDGEIFSTKALENYVQNNESNEEKGYFNLWHINAEDGNFNTDFAKKEWQGVLGRFLVEAGPYLDDKKGQMAKTFFKEFGDKHPSIAPEGWGCSPEFRYLPEERATGTYDTIWITRTSTLPKFAAANVWTETRQFDGGHKMALSESQRKAAVEIFGDDFVSQVTQEAEEKTQELEGSGVAHKEAKEDTQPQEVNIDIETLASEVGKHFQADLTPVAETLSTVAEMVKDLKTRLEKLEEDKAVKDKTELPRFIFNMQRASEKEETVVAEGDALKDQKPSESKGSNDDPWNTIFNK